MNKLEVERLVRKVALLDNRNVNDGVIEAWYEVVGHLSAKVAELALVRARQDVNINYLEPRHVLAKSYDAVADLNREQRELDRNDESQWASVPEPKCAGHGERITRCEPCGLELYKKSQVLPADRLHTWAVDNLYEGVAQ
jgi:hypothetical protein